MSTTGTTNTTNTTTITNTTISSSAGISTTPTANLLGTTMSATTNRTPQDELTKQIYVMDAKAKIDATKKDMRNKFDVSNIENWFNTHLAKYRGIGANDETFFIHVGERIEEDLSSIVEKIDVSYEGESDQQFLEKIKRAYKISSSDRYNEVFSDKMKNLKITEVTKKVVCLFPGTEKDKEGVREDLIFKHLNEVERAAAQVHLESLKELNKINALPAINLPPKEHITMMKEVAERIEHMRHKKNTTVAAVTEQTTDKAETIKLEEKCKALETKIAELSINKLEGREGESSRNYAQNADNDWRRRDNVQRRRYNGGNRYQYGYDSGRGGTHSSNWRREGNRKPQGHYRPPRMIWVNGKYYQKPLDCNICLEHQNNGQNGRQGACEIGCQYNSARICYKHNIFKDDVWEQNCGPWCSKHEPKNV